jgi:hypothetical protein
MKRVLLVCVTCIAFAFAAASPAAAGESQGGISGDVGEMVAAYDFPFSTLRLVGGNFMPGAATFPVTSEDGSISGVVSFRISWCQGFIGYRMDVPGLATESQLSVYLGEADVPLMSEDPICLAGRPSVGGLHAEGFLTSAEVPAELLGDPVAPSINYPSTLPLYEALVSGAARIVVSGDGMGVTGTVR